MTDDNDNEDEIIHYVNSIKWPEEYHVCEKSKAIFEAGLEKTEGLSDEDFFDEAIDFLS